MISGKRTKREDPHRQVFAYGYARVSDQKQLEHESIEAQKARIAEHFRQYVQVDFRTNQQRLVNGKPVEWGGMYVDEAVSARRHKFLHRPAGKQLLGVLRPGDFLIIDRGDRAFRKTLDYLYTYEQLHEYMGVEIHIRQYGAMGTILTSDPAGKMMITNHMAFAEMESAQLGQRVRDNNDYRRSQGLAITGKPPMGCKIVNRFGRKLLVWDEERLAIMQDIVDLYDNQGIGWRRIMRALKAKYGDRFREHRGSLSKLYARYLIYQHLNAFERPPTELPHYDELTGMVKPFMAEHRRKTREKWKPHKWPPVDADEPETTDTPHE